MNSPITRSPRLLLLACLAMLAWSGCPERAPAPSSSGMGPETSSASPESAGKRPTVAYVTNQVADFWLIGQAGAEAGGRDFDVDVTVRMPPTGEASEQRRMLQELLARGVDGIAVSPIDPQNQTDILNECAEHAKLVTQDSDAPNSKRLCYIGVGNYEAGRMCGELVREAIPDGGKVMIFVGRMEQDNAKYRQQGVIDELMGRERDPNHPPGSELGEVRGDKYTVIATRTDGGNAVNAKAQAEDALAAHPDLACMIGLFEYNPPQILEALKTADRLGKVQVVGFDENTATLQAIRDGNCYGTLVQNPYEYGYQSVRILASLIRGDESVLPEGGFLNVPARKITKQNVDEFEAELKSRLAGK